MAATSVSGSTFAIQIVGLTAGNAVGAVPGFSSAARRAFTIATSGSLTNFAANKFTLDSSGSFSGSNPLNNGGFTISSSTNNVVLTFIPSAVYNLSAAASATAIRVGGTSTISATLTSSTATVTNPDSLAYTGFSLSGGLGTLSASGTLVPGASVTGSATFTTLTSGSYAFTPGLSSGSNVALNTAANAGTTLGASVMVYNPAAANAISGTYALGSFLVSSTATQVLSIANIAPNNGFSESLNASFGTPSGVTTNGGSINLLPAGGTSTAMSVYLTSGSAGSASGSVPVNFQTDGQGTSGLSAESLSPQTVNLGATFLDRAVASFTSGSTTSSLLLNFNTVNEGDVVSPIGFNLYNLLQTAGYTADLALETIVSGTGNVPYLSTNLAPFTTLAGGSSNSWNAFVSPTAQGTFTNTWTLNFRSASGGTVFANDLPQSLTLTVSVVVVPEPGTIALAAAGIAAAVVARRRRRS